MKLIRVSCKDESKIDISFLPENKNFTAPYGTRIFKLPNGRFEVVSLIKGYDIPSSHSIFLTQEGAVKGAQIVSRDLSMKIKRSES